MTRLLVIAGILLTLLARADLAKAEPAKGISQRTGVWCDTREQIEMFLDLWDGTNSAEARAVVNDAVKNDNACIFYTALVKVVEEYNERTTVTGTWRVVKVLIVGIQSPAGWTRVLPL